MLSLYLWLEVLAQDVTVLHIIVTKAHLINVPNVNGILQ